MMFWARLDLKARVRAIFSGEDAAMQKDLLCLYDLTADDFDLIFERAADLKHKHKRG